MGVSCFSHVVEVGLEGESRVHDVTVGKGISEGGENDQSDGFGGEVHPCIISIAGI